MAVTRTSSYFGVPITTGDDVVDIKAVLNENIDIRLGDNAGSTTLCINDSDDVNLWCIDSDGNITTTNGTIGLTGSGTDNHIARFDGTDKLQNSGLLIDDAGDLYSLPNDNLTIGVQDQGTGTNNGGGGVTISGGDAGSLSTGGSGGSINLSPGDAKGTSSQSGGNVSASMGAATNGGLIGQFSITGTANVSDGLIHPNGMGYINMTVSPTTNYVGDFVAFKSRGNFGTNFNITGNVYGNISDVRNTSASGILDQGVSYNSVLFTSGTITLGVGLRVQGFESSGTFTTIAALDLLNNSGTIASNHVFNLQASSDWKDGESLTVNDSGTTKHIPLSTANTGITRDSADVTIATTTSGDVVLTAAGDIKFGTHTAIGAETVTGYITIKDSGGTTRKLAVVS